ncbi:MAG TPA: TIGR03617 family F420-dependent LLM class oxidoreductase [Pseudonocardiaceae bacterium]
MFVDAVGGIAADPAELEAAAVAAEAAGYDGFGAPETAHDVFVALALAARATSRITLQSAIAVAFARNPMSLAMLANDVQLVSGGRFQLGLGSQVRAHIERRFGMPWSRPAARMEEYVTTVRAIWRRFETGERLHLNGEFYRHTLMTDFFDPGPNPYGNPPVLVAAVGQGMTEVAGRVADGVLCHSLTTADYLREVTLPAARRGGAGPLFTVALSAFAVLGADAAERARAEAGVRRQLAFYASTPAYRPVLELHGWGGLQDRLGRLARQQAWDEMGAAVGDDVLDAFAVSGTPAEVAARLRDRYGTLVDRLSLNTPYEVDPAEVAAALAPLRTTGG